MTQNKNFISNSKRSLQKQEVPTSLSWELLQATPGLQPHCWAVTEQSLLPVLKLGTQCGPGGFLLLGVFWWVQIENDSNLEVHTHLQRRPERGRNSTNIILQCPLLEYTRLELSETFTTWSQLQSGHDGGFCHGRLATERKITTQSYIAINLFWIRWSRETKKSGYLFTDHKDELIQTGNHKNPQGLRKLKGVFGGRFQKKLANTLDDCFTKWGTKSLTKWK